ncbi:MAG: cache domain-containing protein [Patescibacteria group bacterium]
MSSFLLVNNINLGVDVFGAVVFFIVAWLFTEAYFTKRDYFILIRCVGFFLLAAWQIVHAIYGSIGSLATLGPYLYLIGLVLILASYVFEKLPQRPENFALGMFLSPFFIVNRMEEIASFLILSTTLVLFKRYTRNVDRLLKWLLIGFSFLTAASIMSLFVAVESPNTLWLGEYALKFLAFVAVGIWSWRWLSFRLGEEILLIFIGASLIIALAVTTVFSVFSVQRIESEARNKVDANAKVFTFYLESLQNKALSSSQIIANTEDFASAVKSNDFKDIESISRELLALTGQQFIAVALTNGQVIFKLNASILRDENILAQKIGAEAIEGRPAVTLAQVEGGGLAIQAGAPILFRGEIIGAIITGVLLNNQFAASFKTMSGLDTSLVKDDIVIVSTILEPGDKIHESTLAQAIASGEEYIGGSQLLNNEVMSALVPLRDLENQRVGALMLTTAPGQLSRDNQRINLLTMLIVAAVVIGLIIPLYYLTTYLLRLSDI